MKPVEMIWNMIDLVTTLKDQKIFKACILVLKSSAVIDQQYKDTIKYYATLLPDLFSQNCLIVLTHYATDPHTVAVREYQGHDQSSLINIIAILPAFGCWVLTPSTSRIRLSQLSCGPYGY